MKVTHSTCATLDQKGQAAKEILTTVGDLGVCVGGDIVLRCANCLVNLCLPHSEYALDVNYVDRKFSSGESVILTQE
jgi:hypothetical protein